jgi:predicted dehydrogenase
MRSVASHPNVQIVALCDVDSRPLEVAGREFSQASRHRDWRELLANHGHKFDAVTIGTPDHMHAAPAVTAIRAGKHVYLQKPMAATLHECRVIAEAAAQTGVVTQLGNQGRSSIESRAAVDMIRGGAIGKIKEVVLWENKRLSWWPKNTTLRTQSDPIPPELDWDLWLGVQEPRPYLENTYHPKTWRAWFDFGVGEMGDMGCHHFDISFDALRLTAPLRVRQTTPGSSGPLWGDRRRVELVFPGGEQTADDTVRLTWYDGAMRPDTSDLTLPPGLEVLPDSGGLWVGDEGFLFKPYQRPAQLFALDGQSKSFREPGLAEQNHYHDWVDAILENRKAWGDFSHGGPLTESVLVGAVADRFAGEWLEWDRQTQTFTNHAGATSLVRRNYRQGWEVDGLG